MGGVGCVLRSPNGRRRMPGRTGCANQIQHMKAAPTEIPDAESNIIPFPDVNNDPYYGYGDLASLVLAVLEPELPDWLKRKNRKGGGK